MRVYAELRAQERATRSFGYELWVHDLTVRKLGKWGSDDVFDTKEAAVETGAEVAKSFLEQQLDLPPEVYTLEIKN
tara:strand:- start:336 stop:563 length:228 start_codon:yes stop_codon:yes gene_type:complete